MQPTVILSDAHPFFGRGLYLILGRIDAPRLERPPGGSYVPSNLFAQSAYQKLAVSPVQDFKHVRSLRNDLNAPSTLRWLKPESLEAFGKDGFRRSTPTLQVSKPN